VSDLKRLVELCRAEVSVEVNSHKAIYETAAEYLADWKDRHGTDDFSPEVEAEMIARDCIVRVQAYPDTPVGFYLIWDSDVDRAINRAIAAIEGER